MDWRLEKMFGRLGKLSSRAASEWRIWCALRCEVRCGQENLLLMVRGVSVPQRLH